MSAKQEDMIDADELFPIAADHRRRMAIVDSQNPRVRLVRLEPEL